MRPHELLFKGCQKFNETKGETIYINQLYLYFGLLNIPALHLAKAGPCPETQLEPGIIAMYYHTCLLSSLGICLQSALEAHRLLVCSSVAHIIFFMGLEY